MTAHMEWDGDWSRVASAWEAHSEQVEAISTQVTTALLDGLQLRAGQRVLELGAGTGELAVRLAEQVQPGGTVLATDAAAGMVDVIRRRTDGVAGIDVAQLDATDIGLDAGSFDAVVFRMGLMLTTEPERALEAIRRVVAPAGRLALAVWAAPQDNPWMTSVGMAAMMHGLVQGGPPTGPGGPFSLADPEHLEKIVRGAGFTQVRVDAVSYTRLYPDLETYFDTVRHLAPPIALATAAASAETLAAVRATVEQLTAQYRDGTGLRVPAKALVCIAS